MIIAVAGGKGGTGKTLVSTSLALSAAPVQFLDCDVEEPNAEIFLSPRPRKTVKVSVKAPRFQGWKGSPCGEGAAFCRYSALAAVKDRMLVFPELCVSCGGCFLLCPSGVLSPVEHTVGGVKTGTARRGIDFTGGELAVGQQRTELVIQKVKGALQPGSNAVIDCPPGAGRALMEAVRGSDFCLLVTEPTPFGLHDLKAGKRMLDIMEIPAGVVINRAGGSYTGVDDWCREEGLAVLLKIPFSAAVAGGAARGMTLPEIDRSWEERLRELWERLRRGLGTGKD